MFLVSFAAGFALLALIGAYFGSVGWMLPASAGLALLWILVRKNPRLRLVRPALLGGAIALVWLVVYGAIFLSPAQALYDRTIQMEATVTGYPQATSYGVSIPVKAGEAGGRQVKALFYGSSDLADLEPGDQIASIAYCTPSDSTGEDGLYQTAQGILLKAKGYGAVTVTKCQGVSLRYALPRLAEKARDLVDQLYPESQAAFLRALLTGDKSQLSDQTKHSLNRVGLSHTVVISGLHVSFLVGLLSMVCKPRGKKGVAATIAVLVLFCLLTGSAPGTVRATILSSLALLAPRLDRDYHPLTGLGAALLVLLLANPYAVAGAGLQFSFLSTLGILLFGQKWEQSWRAGVPKKYRPYLRPLLGTVAVSLGAMVFTVPLSAFYFGSVSLLAPLANLAAGWAVAASFLGGFLSLGAGAICLPLGKALAVLVGLPVRFFLWFAEWGSTLPLAAVTAGKNYYGLWLGFVYGVFLLVLLWPGERKRLAVPACACVATFCLAALLTAQTDREADLTLTALDIGQGQSIALWSGDACALVDCGGTLQPGDTAAAYFQSRGRSTLDLLVLTHFHDDHAAGVPELLARMKVGAIVYPDVDQDSSLRQEIEALAQEQGTTLYPISANSTVSFGQATLTIFSPVDVGTSSNEQSLSLLCQLGDWEALITGDMPIEGEQALVHRETLPDIELLIAGHHGSKYASGDVLLRTVTPETAIISVGENSYGHPAEETLERLSDIGAQIYRTDQSGAVTVKVNRSTQDPETGSDPGN